MKTVYEIARDAIIDVIKDPSCDMERRIHAVKALHEICEAMRGTECTDLPPPAQESKESLSELRSNYYP